MILKELEIGQVYFRIIDFYQNRYGDSKIEVYLGELKKNIPFIVLWKNIKNNAVIYQILYKDEICYINASSTKCERGYFKKL